MKMAQFKTSLWILLIFTLLHDNEAATPFFLQAIASALSTIPFTAGPMTTGLVGAKLAVGSKLLYYLGFFGRRRSKPKPPARAKPKSTSGNPRFPPGMQYPQQFGGGFPQQYGGFNQPAYWGQYPYGYDQAQMYQMLAAQGVDPALAMQALAEQGVGSQAVPSSPFPFPPGGGAMPGGPIPASGAFPSMPSSQSGGGGFQNTQGSQPGGGGQGESDNDVESFFTFLRDMDDNTCISRLICDIGANPSFLGDFSENIHSIVSSLNVQPSSGAYQYIAIMETGKREGGCAQRFPQCGDSAYEIVKNVAPTIGVPENINIDDINKL